MVQRHKIDAFTLLLQHAGAILMLDGLFRVAVFG
jgi:hypothetical protein